MRDFFIILGAVGTAVAVAAYLQDRRKERREARLWKAALVGAPIAAALVTAFKF